MNPKFFGLLLAFTVLACANPNRDAAQHLIDYFSAPLSERDSEVMFQKMCETAPVLAEFDLASFLEQQARIEAGSDEEVDNREMDQLQLDLMSALSQAFSDKDFKNQFEQSGVELNTWAWQSAQSTASLREGSDIDDAARCQAVATFVIMAALKETYGDIESLMFPIDRPDLRSQ